MEKLIIAPTLVTVENLHFHQSGNQFETYNKHITGTITIEFSTLGDFSKFTSTDLKGKVTIDDLSSAIALCILNKKFEI